MCVNLLNGDLQLSFSSKFPSFLSKLLHVFSSAAVLLWVEPLCPPEAEKRMGKQHLHVSAGVLSPGKMEKDHKSRGVC